MNWKCLRLSPGLFTVRAAAKTHAARLLGGRASSNRPGYTRGQATIEIATFGALCAAFHSLPEQAFMLGGEATSPHDRLYRISIPHHVDFRSALETTPPQGKSNTSAPSDVDEGEHSK
jgi:hypothetical protein